MNTSRSDKPDHDRSAPALIPSLADGSALAFHKAEKTRLVPCLINLLLRENIRSHPGICKPQTNNPLGFAKTGKRKLGTKSCSLATAALLHFVFVPSLLHSKKRIFQHRHQATPHHPSRQLPAKPVPRLYARSGFGQTPAGWTDVPRRSGRRPPAHRLSTLANVRR
ncbi:MAG: hypothetical protein Q7U53_17205 [Anaerolineaceae bacterium]|nr:hypothetical protein [Anaerolineaceae bacterium]